MKKINLFFGIVLMTLFNCYAQEYILQEKTVESIFEVEGKSRTEIFTSINKWIALNYNSAQNVVQLNDKESGNIIIKGINQAVYKNVMKELYPKNKYMQEFSTVEFNHTMEVNIKDDKFRIIYTLTDIITPSPVAGYNLESQYNMVFDMLDFTGLKQEKIDNYNNYIEELWKKSMVGKKKREEFKEMTKPTFEEMNKGVIESIKLTMLSIGNTVKSSKKDDW
ncbi:DUF4468 domain-containing protein [Cellulophaga sp. Z1A5H]|uniref:DUF4468 domain-containing protein n=1 Tax=Cellulophaga sp. Z1A5H TaxID=2687291 RepID=UPI0013FE44CE|nr:DUF4468 domain-containing protein [Cellulophaga sp. Z1A5H]